MTSPLLVSFPLLAILAGCAHTPAAVPAPSNLPARWEAATPMPTGEIAGAWWSSFGDPVLDGLIDSGQQHNVDLRIAAERVIASHALRRAATAGLFPEIGAEAGVTAARRATSDSASIGLGASWEPDIGGRLSAAGPDPLAVPEDGPAPRPTGRPAGAG